MHFFATEEECRAELLGYYRDTPDWLRELVGNAMIRRRSSRNQAGVDVFMYVRSDDVHKSGFRQVTVEAVLRNAFIELTESEPLLCFHLLPYPEPEEEDGSEQGLNNCFFKTNRTIEHDELRFRSQPEILIYRELSKRQLLFFPNAAAVLGGAKATKREPDFLICHDGKWGILEVMGKGYHNATTAVNDHERARLFKKYGVLCMEFFDADDCMTDPSGVVDRFLAILNKH